MGIEERVIDWIGRSRMHQGVGLLVLAWTLTVGAVADAQAPPGQDAPVADDPVEVLDVPGRSATPRTGRGSSGPGLDDLLRLPSDFTANKASERPVAGASEDEWRRRFSGAEKAIGEARETLIKTKRELDGMAESGGANQWSVAPPGASGQQTTSPLSFKLRQELARNRATLEEAEKALRELRIEADLAGVPAAWRVVASNPPAPPTPE
jgi:hypothetical protein